MCAISSSLYLIYGTIHYIGYVFKLATNHAIKLPNNITIKLLLTAFFWALYDYLILSQ